jgi:hypothetical protein
MSPEERTAQDLAVASLADLSFSSTAAQRKRSTPTSKELKTTSLRLADYNSRAGKGLQHDSGAGSLREFFLLNLLLHY